MKLLRLIKKTSGGNHGWYETDQGYNVRKPLGMIYNQEIEPEVEKHNWSESTYCRPEGMRRPTTTSWQWVKNLVKKLWT